MTSDDARGLLLLGGIGLGLALWVLLVVAVLLGACTAAIARSRGPGVVIVAPLDDGGDGP